MADDASNELKSLKLVFVGGFFVVTVLTIFVIIRLNGIYSILERHMKLLPSYTSSMGNIELQKYEVVKADDGETVVYKFKVSEDWPGDGMDYDGEMEPPPEEPVAPAPEAAPAE